MKKIKKFFKITFITLAIIFSITAIFSATYYSVVTNAITLDINKLEKTKTALSLKIYDSNFKEILPDKSNYIKIEKLSKNTKNAFISAEDKRFYKHKGVDLIRICGAISSNIKTKSFSEGASTISQQLVKNTQLSNKKTIKRKLQEIKLTKQLENKYSKDEILEMYLNNIYFGNGCYGLESASKHYFNKSSSDLTLSESALLAGTINAPSYYNIETNLDRAIERRNLILNLMNKYNKISNEEKEQAVNEKINLNISSIQSNNYLYNQIMTEAKLILNSNENFISNSNYKIYSYINLDLLDKVADIQKTYSNKNYDNMANIIIDNKTHGIICECGTNNSFKQKWQPGSAIKPILVYAPAIEKNIISPSTKLLDKKINISGYTPENSDKEYHGYISAKTALANSLNIPAVKLLNEIGIEEAKNFAKKQGIEFDETDNHLALALGGFSKGTTLKSLCDAYSTFANNGLYQQSSYISKITQNGKIIYQNINHEKQTMKDSTAFLITDMLMETAKTGTAKRLKNFDFELASKTGTVGKQNSKNNTCAYNISYTKNHTILSFISGENLPSNINGSTHPTLLSKDIIESLYLKSKPQNFSTPSSIQKTQFNKEFYKKTNKITNNSKNNCVFDYFSIENPLKETEENSLLKIINSSQNKPILCFNTKNGFCYEIIRENKNKEEIISSLSGNNSPQRFEDNTAKTNEIYSYKLKIKNLSTNEEFYSNIIKLKSY